MSSDFNKYFSDRTQLSLWYIFITKSRAAFFSGRPVKGTFENNEATVPVSIKQCTKAWLPQSN